MLKPLYFLRNSNDSGPPVCSKSIKMMNVADFLRVYLNFVEFRGISWNFVESRGISWNFVEFRGISMEYDAIE